MTNREYYKEEILDIACMCSAIAVDKKTGEVRNCKNLPDEPSLSCSQCLFNNDDRTDCTEECLKWANAEHIEKLKLTKNEKLFLSLLKKRWHYIARDVDGALLVYSAKPIKMIDMWEADADDTADIDALLLADCKFSIVKWEDKDPWLIEDLMKLPTEEEK